MDDKKMDSYFDVIAGLIVDENKIVTYKSLSRSLGIHVNTAKQLLYAYIKNEKYRNSFPISATYLIAGKVIDGSFNITVVNEAHLKDSYTSFTEITSEHIYSVQKGKNLKEVLFLSGIGQELINLKSSNLVIKHHKEVIKIKEEVKKKHENHEEQSRKISDEALVPERQNVIAMESKTKIERANHKITSESPKKSIIKGYSFKASTSIKKPFGNIANIFAKVSQKNPDNSVIKKKNEINFKNMSKEVDTGVLNNEKEIHWSKSEYNITEERNELKDSLKRKKRSNKRKRIQLLSDSEDDSNDEIEGNSFIFNTNLEEKVLEKEEEENEKIKELISRSKKKKRKVIDRTVMNEDGYLETKKEIVFETDSENELEEIATPSTEQIKLNIDKNKDLQGGRIAKKQSSLLTFFRKI